jgi:hypothetical protein
MELKDVVLHIALHWEIMQAHNLITMAVAPMSHPLTHHPPILVFEPFTDTLHVFTSRAHYATHQGHPLRPFAGIYRLGTFRLHGTVNMKLNQAALTSRRRSHSKMCGTEPVRDSRALICVSNRKSERHTHFGSRKSMPFDKIICFHFVCDPFESSNNRSPWRRSVRSC